jgi:hypothetical protein
LTARKRVRYSIALAFGCPDKPPLTRVELYARALAVDLVDA